MDRPGLCHLPGGEATYRSLARAHTSLDATPDELHRTGLAEIDRIDVELTDLVGRTIGTRTLPDALAALRGDPALHFGTRDEVFAKAVSALERATEAIPGWFGRLPQAPCEVVRMGAHEEEHSTIAYYRHPAEDGSRPGQYYVNTAHPETRPRYEAEVLAYHESIPGHHLQIAIAQELADLPAFRRHLGPTAFFEGWGLYTERLADEMGLYSGDLDRIGVLSFDAWRASRLVVDTGMHAMGWTRQQAIDFMLEHTALAPNNIANEVDRYIVIPGQALAYKTGQLEILRLRAEARERARPWLRHPRLPRCRAGQRRRIPRPPRQPCRRLRQRPDRDVLGARHRPSFVAADPAHARYWPGTPRRHLPENPWPPIARSPTPAPRTPASATATR